MELTRRTSRFPQFVCLRVSFARASQGRTVMTSSFSSNVDEMVCFSFLNSPRWTRECSDWKVTRTRCRCRSLSSWTKLTLRRRKSPILREDYPSDPTSFSDQRRLYKRCLLFFFCSQSTISIFFNRVIIIRCFLFSLGDVIPFIGRDAPAGAAQRPVEFEAAIHRSREGKP